MIVFDLKCGSGGHVFEAWFGSNRDYEEQLSRGLVACPLCGDLSVGKAVMAPRISGKGSTLAGGDQAVKAALADLAKAQEAVLANSTYVGPQFAREARAMHEGERDARPIYGIASPDEAKSLLEEGIPVAPLPLPIVPPGRDN